MRGVWGWECEGLGVRYVGVRGEGLGVWEWECEGLGVRYVGM